MPITWSETKARMKDDKDRLLEATKEQGFGKPSFLFLHPSYQAVWLHRVAHFFFGRGQRVLARFFWHLNLLLTGADISPISDLGGGLVINCPLCVILVGKMGRNCTVFGHSGLGGGMGKKDVGAGPGLPVVGNEVVFSYSSSVIGPIHVGNRVLIGPKCFVLDDVPDDTVVESDPSVQKPRKPNI